MTADRMPHKFVGLIKAYCASTKIKVKSSGVGSMIFEIRSSVLQRCAYFFDSVTYCFLHQSLPDHARVQVGTRVDFAYADDVMPLSNN